MRRLTVRIEDHESPYFPYQARWKQSGTGYCAVFESKEQLKGYFSNRYYPRSVVYHDYTGAA